MKFLQIAVASDAENGQSLYALGEDSNIYECAANYHQHGNMYQVRKVTRGFYSPNFWRKIDMPFEEPEIDSERAKLYLDESAG